MNWKKSCQIAFNILRSTNQFLKSSDKNMKLHDNYYSLLACSIKSESMSKFAEDPISTNTIFCFLKIISSSFQ